MARKRSRNKANPEDALAVVERLVKRAAEAGLKTVDVNLGMLAVVVDLAQTARKARGGQQLSGRHKVAEATALALALGRRRKLMAQGKSAEEAAQIAAEEASVFIHKLTKRNLAPSTIKRRMQDRH